MPLDNQVELYQRLDTPEFRELLLFLVGWRDDDAANQQEADWAIERYRSDPSLHAFGTGENGRLSGMIGIEIKGSERAIIYQIVVHPASRQKGLAAR